MLVLYSYMANYNCSEFSGDETEVECVPPCAPESGIRTASTINRMYGSSHRTAKRAIYWTIPSTTPKHSCMIVIRPVKQGVQGRASRCFAWKAAPASPKKPALRLYRNFESAFQVLSSSSTINLSIRAEICMVDSFLCCFPSLHNVMGLHPSQHQKGVARCT